MSYAGTPARERHGFLMRWTLDVLGNRLFGMARLHTQHWIAVGLGTETAMVQTCTRDAGSPGLRARAI